jgi:hypothetical protein
LPGRWASGKRLNMDDKPSEDRAPEPRAGAAGASRAGPSERFWPYVELSESPSEEELSALEPGLAAALSPPGSRPFSVTIVFPPLDSPDYERAVELARQSPEYRQVGVFHRARFMVGDIAKVHELWMLVGDFDSAQVLIDDRALPYARQLWLPLMRFLLRG